MDRIPGDEQWELPEIPYWHMVTSTNYQQQNSDARPASSINIYYKPNQKVNPESWIIQNTINVKESTGGTYFMVVGWQPGGYSGIQERSKNEHVAIFSMWCRKDGVDCPKKVRSGDGVTVSNFGGEGTGLKSIKEDFPWKENEDVTFRVTGRFVRRNTWDDGIQNYPNKI